MPRPRVMGSLRAGRRQSKERRPSKPKSSNSSSAVNNSGSVGGNITPGPCSNIQIGGEGNIASSICGPQLRFPESNIDKLTGLLAGQSGTVSIDVNNADSLTIRDANNLLTAFAKAHWTTSGVNQTTHGTDIGTDGLPIPDPLGIHLHARSERLALAEFVGSAQEFDGACILSRFLKNDKFCFCDRHALRLEQ
jgi:hypothetical protein